MIYSKSLEHVVSPLPLQTQVLPGGDINNTVVNSICHLIFSDRKSKHQYFSRVSYGGVIHIITNDIVVPINSKDKHQVTVRTWDQLCGCLNQLLTSRLEWAVSEIIVDDLSQYYWHAKKNNQLNKYQQLIKLVKTVQARFRCNLILVSWDNRFEKGYHFKNNYGTAPVQLSDVSYLPKEYYNLVDQIIYIEANTNVYRFQDQWQSVNRIV